MTPKLLFSTILLLLLCACSTSKHSAQPKEELRYANDTSCSEPWCNQVGEIIKNPEQVTHEKLEDGFANGISRWFYGQGLGVTTLNIGTAVVFPPYALYLLGNAGLQLAGYDPLYVTDALPEKPREGVMTIYNAVTSTPGQITSTIAGAEFYKAPPANISTAASKEEK